MTSACDAQNKNKITSLAGAVFLAGLTTLDLVSSRVFLIVLFFKFCDIGGDWWDLTSACDAQSYNQITSLAGAVFPAGLKTLRLVSSRVFFILCRWALT